MLFRPKTNETSRADKSVRSLSPDANHHARLSAAELDVQCVEQHAKGDDQ